MNNDCPDNSTECLLRALIYTTAHNSSPWEPRNFGFTVAIGVAAFAISIVTVFQALFAAGPGRIKGSSNAIGTFSKLTKGRISWIEFAWRSTAQTPLITVQGLIHGLAEQTLLLRHGINFPVEAGSSTTGASWYHLLHSTGLHEDIKTTFEGALQPCATDHLPADVQAPPAAIELRCLALLAGFADPSTSYAVSNDELLISGKISQLSSRNHPVLGSLVAYDRYQTEVPVEINQFSSMVEFCILRSYGGMKPFACRGRCTQFALDLAKGQLQLLWKFGSTKETRIIKRLNEFTEDGLGADVYAWGEMFLKQEPFSKGYLEYAEAKALALIVAQTDYEVRPYPWAFSQTMAAAKILHMHAAPHIQDGTELLEAISPLLAGTEYENYDKRDPHKDTKFDYFGSWLPPLPTNDISINGTFAYWLWNEICSQCTRFALRMGFEGVVNPTNRFLDRKDKETTTAWYLLKHIDILLRRNYTNTLLIYSHMTNVWIQGLTECDGQTTHKTTCTPNVLSPGGNRASSPVSPYTTKSPSSSRLCDERNPEEIAKASQHSQDNTTFGKQPISHQVLPEAERNAIETLLVLRGLLYAILLEAGPDTSLLFADDFKNSIVKIM